MNIVEQKLEAYAEAHSEKPPPLLAKLREETFSRMNSPGMQVGALEGAFLKMMVRLTGARRILEIGMFTGYSALMMAEALPDDGELITCDIDPEAEAIARRYFSKSPHGKKIHVRMGPALETIAGLKGTLDVVFIDADKENYSAYYDAVFPLVKSGGLIMADNMLWSGRVLEPQEQTDHALVAFNKKVASGNRVEKIMVTLRDGVTLIRKH